MQEEFRRCYNQAYTRELYHAYLEEACRRFGAGCEFRLAETPVFLPEDLRRQLIRASEEIMEQLCEPARLRAMTGAVPPAWDTPRMTPLPSFALLDFAVTRAPDGALVPRLIELQGFPSITAMMVIMRDVWNEVLQRLPGLDFDWCAWFSGLDRDRFLDLARRTIVGGHDPATVVLMDIDPPSQKTYPDFAATRLLFGVDPVCPRAVIRNGSRLFRKVDGRNVPIRRIYNRIVFDELAQKKPVLPFAFTDDLEVEWAPHPNWYWAWSKHSLPYLNHPAVPAAKLLSELDSTPDDLSRFVLKPLFSFAGGGVKIAPSLSDIEAIPEHDRQCWCLQQRVDYEPVLRTPGGAGAKVEVRMMFLKPDDVERPILALNLCRLARGLMLGVDFNKGYDWVGGAIGIWPAG